MANSKALQMTRAIPHPVHRRHIQIYDEDWDWLETQWPILLSAQQELNPGMRISSPGALIREIIHSHVKRAKVHYNQILESERDLAERGGTHPQYLDDKETAL